MRILYSLLFFLSFSLSAQIQDSTTISDTQELIYDLNSQKEPQDFDQQKIQEYQQEDAFDYTEHKEADNWWTRLKKWLHQLWLKFLRSFFGVEEIVGFWTVVLKVIIYSIVIGTLFLLGWLFMKINPGDMLLEKQSPPQVTLTEDEDIIQNQDIQQLINQALQHKNYRLAIRYYYLLVLKKLSDQEFIHWEAQKTNTDYIKELNDTVIKKQFTMITRLYDFIWYGNFEINELSFQQAEKEFQSITQKMQS